MAKTVSVTFDVTAYPNPHEVTFAFLGETAVNSTPQTDYKGITIGGSCQRGNRLYMPTCVVTLYEVTSVAVGLYEVRVINTEGQTTLQLEISLDGMLM